MVFSLRLAAIRQVLQQHHADAFLLINNEYSGQPGTGYLCGFTGSTSVLVITRDRVWLFVDGRYVIQAQHESKESECFPISGSGFLKDLSDLLSIHRVSWVLVDGTKTTYTSVQKLVEFLPTLRIENASNILQILRITKDEKELRCIQHAVDIAARAFSRLLPTISPGVSEQSLAMRLDMLMREEGAQGMAFDTICVSGVRGALPHGQPTTKTIALGELVTFDFGAVYQGYSCDITRTIACGDISSKLRDIYECVRNAQSKGCDSVRAMISGKHIDDVCRSLIASAGYGQFFLHATGHGLGLEVHELPMISQTADVLLPQSCVVTCEPGIYIDGLGGVRIEDDLVITADGNRNMSGSLPRELVTVGLS